MTKRTYDIHSRQDDIKFMKELDFQGLYVIKNLTNKRYYIGRGDKVFRKVDRHFRGYGNQEVFVDYSKKDEFVVSFIKFDDSEYDNMDEFEKKTKAYLKFELKDYLCYDEVLLKQTPEPNNGLDDGKIQESESGDKNRIKELRKKRWMAFIFHRKKIMLETSTTDFIGQEYGVVIDKIKENGFINIKTMPIKDIYVGSEFISGEVEQVVMNGKYACQQGEMIPYDTEIMIIYHLKKELMFPYSARQVKKQDFEMLLRELQDIGFTKIEMIAIKDLKIGWILKEGSVEKVTINWLENYKKDLVVDYDAEIVIHYHTFR